MTCSYMRALNDARFLETGFLKAHSENK